MEKEKRPTEFGYIWIERSLNYIDENGIEHTRDESQNQTNYSTVKSSVYPHLGQEKASATLP